MPGGVLAAQVLAILREAWRRRRARWRGRRQTPALASPGRIRLPGRRDAATGLPGLARALDGCRPGLRLCGALQAAQVGDRVAVVSSAVLAPAQARLLHLCGGCHGPARRAMAFLSFL